MPSRTGPFVPVGGRRGPVLRCTGRAYSLCSCICSPSSSGRRWSRFPGPGLPRFVLLRRRRPIDRRRPRPQRRLRLDLRRGRRQASRPTAVLPIPSNAHWLPLASFLQAPFIAVLGPTAIASAPPDGPDRLAHRAAHVAHRPRRRRPADRGAARASLPRSRRPATVFMAQPENFAILQPLVAATLWLTARGLKGDGRSFALAGLLVGPGVARPQRRLHPRAGRWPRLRWDRVGPGFGTRPARIPWRAAIGCIALLSSSRWRLLGIALSIGAPAQFSATIEEQRAKVGEIVTAQSATR